MAVIPLRLPPAEVHIHADRRLAFQVITAFGASQGIKRATSRLLDRESDGRLLVEFHTPATGLLGRRKVYRTVDRVTLHEHERVEFEGVEGPLTLLRERFLLTSEGTCTRLCYESTIGVRGWTAGWLIARFYVQPRLRRHMREHLEEIKATVEARCSQQGIPSATL